MNTPTNKPADRNDDLESLLDDLYSLQKNLLDNKPHMDIDLPEDVVSDEFDSLDIPILTESLDMEIDRQQPAGPPSEVQQHLFDSPAEQSAKQATTPQTLSDRQIDAIVDKVVAKALPGLEARLRQRVREKVLARLQRK